MNKVSALLNLRLLQAGRLISEVGILLILLGLFALTGPLLKGIAVAMGTNSLYSIPIAALIIVSIDFSRNDKNFLKNTIGSRLNFGLYLFAEYLILTLPIVLFQLIFGHWLTAISLSSSVAILGYLLTFMSKPGKNGFKAPLNFVPLSLFELKFYLEKNKPKTIIIAMLILLGSVHVSLWILGLIFFIASILEIFIPKEPLEMLHYEPKFLMRKIASYSLLFLALIVIPTIIVALRNDLTYWVYVYGFICVLIATALAISYKYSTYDHLSEKVKTSMPMVVITFLMLVPGFGIVTLIKAIMTYFKAKAQLKKIYA